MQKEKRIKDLEAGLEDAAETAETMILRDELGIPISASRSLTVFRVLARQARKVLGNK